MNPRALRFVYEAVSRLGLNPALKAAAVPDTRLIELMEGSGRLEQGRALDLGCGGGRNAIYLAQHGWDVTGVDMVGRAIIAARAKAEESGVSVRFLQGDVTRLESLPVGDGFDLLVDSGCYYTLGAEQRDAFAAGVTRVARPGALLLMSGFVKMPVTGAAGISADDLRQRFPRWELGEGVDVPTDEILRHTPVPRPLKAAMLSGRHKIRRFELVREAA